jgi:hypothetical protein
MWLPLHTTSEVEGERQQIFWMAKESARRSVQTRSAADGMGESDSLSFLRETESESQTRDLMGLWAPTQRGQKCVGACDHILEGRTCWACPAEVQE